MADLIKNIELNSGRKVEIKSPSRRQRAQLQDISQECKNRKIPISMEMCLDFVIACTGKSEAVLDMENWEETEIVECATECFPLLAMTGTDKKKLK